MNNYIKYSLITLLMGAAIFEAGARLVYSNETIPIPADLIGQYDETMAKIVPVENQIKNLQVSLTGDYERIQQILRLTADRNKILPSQYDKYDFNRECKCLKLKEQK